MTMAKGQSLSFERTPAYEVGNPMGIPLTRSYKVPTVSDARRATGLRKGVGCTDFPGLGGGTNGEGDRNLGFSLLAWGPAASLRPGSLKDRAARSAVRHQID